MVKLFKISLIGIIVLILSASASNAQKYKEVKIALPSWVGAQLIAYNLGNRIKKFGRSVKYVEMKTDQVWKEMDKDKGAVDLFPDLWMPNQDHNWSIYVEKKKSVTFNRSPYSGYQGFYAFFPLKTQLMKFDINSLSSLETIKLFDTDNNGLAEYWPGETGWHAKLFSQVKMNNYQLQDKWEEIDAKNGEFLKILETRQKQNKPVLFYYWKPDWIYKKYNIVEVSEAAYHDGCKNVVEPSVDSDWLAKSSFRCAYPKSTVYVVFRDDFIQDQELSHLLQNYQVSVPKLEQAMLMSEEKKTHAKNLASYLN